MRKILVLSFMCFVAQNLLAQDTTYYYKSWEKALKASKKTNKLIFLDAFTSWCGPCKRMEVTTFKNPEVIKMLNENFIPIKLNMERGEGIQLAKTYRIGGYPTFLFVDSQGNMLHSEAGFKDEKLFLEMCKNALNPTERLAGLDAKFQKGDWDADFLQQYIDKRAILMNASQDAAVEAYLKLLPDWSQSKAMDFIMNYVQNPSSLGFLYLLEHKNLFKEKYGAEKVNSQVESIVYQELTRGLYHSDIASMEKVINMLYPDNSERLVAKYKTTYYQSTIDADGFMKATLEYTGKFPPEDPAEWADLAVGLSSISQNKQYLSTAMSWLEKSLKEEETFECQLAKAYVFKAMRKNKKAKKMAQQTINWAKEKQENFAPAVQFLSTFE
jgi:thiol-disulfide isomerase/thioredoxin